MKQLTILVVDDDPGVMGFLSLALTAQGYPILQAATVEVALHIVYSHDAIIDLLIIDYRLQNANGWQVATRVLRTRPYMKVLYISGKPREILMDEGSLGPADVFLQKPFLPNILIAKVRELLDTVTSA